MTCDSDRRSESQDRETGLGPQDAKAARSASPETRLSNTNPSSPPQFTANEIRDIQQTAMDATEMYVSVKMVHVILERAAALRAKDQS